MKASRLVQLVVGICALLATLGCGSRDSLSRPTVLPTASNDSPTSQTATTLEPQAKVLPGPGVTLSGRVHEVRPDGSRTPIAARQVAIEVEVSDVRDPNRGGWVPVSADGRYRVEGVLDGRFVKVVGVDTSPSPRRYKLCAANTMMRGDTQFDIAVFQEGAPLPGPTLSGRIVAMIDEKLVPVAGADIYFTSLRGYGSDVWQFTDRDGRFNLCGIPPIPGEVRIFCGNDILIYRQAVDIRTDTVIDIDATSFYRCLGLTSFVAARQPMRPPPNQEPPGT
jgi:hypothetical protein